MDAPLATPTFIYSFFDYLINLTQKDVDNSLSASFPVRLCQKKKKKKDWYNQSQTLSVKNTCFLMSTRSWPHYTQKYIKVET